MAHTHDNRGRVKMKRIWLDAGEFERYCGIILAEQRHTAKDLARDFFAKNAFVRMIMQPENSYPVLQYLHGRWDKRFH